MSHSVWLYIAVMAIVIYLLRVLPITLIRWEIKNRFVRSVLYYIPYVTLSVMTVPAIFAVTDDPLCGLAALICAAVISWCTSILILSALVACAAVFLISIL